MFTLINSSLQIIQNNSIARDYFSEATQKYAKIAAIACVIFGAFTALYFIYRNYKGEKLKSEESKIPAHLNPKGIEKEEPGKKDVKKGDQGKKDVKKGDQGKKDVKEDDQGKKDVKGDDQGKKDLPKKIPTPQKKVLVSDEEYAKQLQQEYDEEDRLKKPFNKPNPGKKNTPPQTDDELTQKLIKKMIEEDLRQSEQDPSKKDNENKTGNSPKAKTEDELNAEAIQKLLNEDDAAIASKPKKDPIPNSPIDLKKPQSPQEDKKDATKKPAKSPKIEPVFESPKNESPKNESPKNESPKNEKPKTPSSPFTQIDEICGQISEKAFTDSSFSAVKALSGITTSKLGTQIEAQLNEIVEEYHTRHQWLQKLEYGEPVPAYFANALGSQSNEEKKYLSLAGIRNLYKYGPRIIDDLSKKKFLGGEHHYNHNEGLKLFKEYTGNTVDLDTEFDAPSDAEAIKETEKMIVNFGKMCGLKGSFGQELSISDVERQLPNRKLKLPRKGAFIHDVGQDNLDRSNHAIWKRTTPSGKSHYYANVPNCNIVMVATLKLPYLLAELAFRVKEKNDGKLPKDFLDEFFDKGLSTQCYTAKTPVFLDFYQTWMAKLNGELTTPEEDARRRLAKGEFGEALQKKNPDEVLKEAFTIRSLTAFLQDIPACKCNKRSFETYNTQTRGEIVEKLKAEGLWEAALYHIEEGADYFLLDQSSLNLFIKTFYDYMVVDEMYD